MEGITILNSYEYLTNFSIIFALIMLCALLFSASVLTLFALVKYGFYTCKGLVFLVACIAFTIICSFCIPEKKYETLYQVTIDDSVSMAEFTSKYEVVKQEGSLYTIIEKTNKE